MALGAGGRLLLRIEDIDLARCTPEHEVAMLRDLAWLGLEWERPVRRQSEHFADYRSALESLVVKGLAYPAFMSRGRIRGLRAITRKSTRGSMPSGMTRSKSFRVSAS